MAEAARRRKAQLGVCIAVLLSSPVYSQDIPRVSASDAATAEQNLYLSVILNETPRPGLFAFTLRGDQLYTDRDTLISIGFSPDVLLGASGLIPLREFVAATIDTSTQSVRLLAPLTSLQTSVTWLTTEWRGSDPNAVIAPAMPGALLNYTINLNQTDEQETLTGHYAFRAFGTGRAFLETSGLVNATGTAEQNGFIHRRLDTQVRWNDPERALQVQIGDVLTGGTLSWTRQTRVGGFRIARNFGELQPTRMLSPLPVFAGSATVPSSVELFVNGMKQYSTDVPVGPFSVQNVPGFTGAGMATLVVTDMFGQRRAVELPFFFSQQLLNAGLSDWSLTGGLIRRNYAVRDFDYATKPVLSASFRRGMTPTLTLEGTSDFSSRLQNGGLGAVFLVKRIGVFHLAQSLSALDGIRGRQSLIEYQWNNRTLTVNWRRVQSNPGYRDIGSLESDAVIARVNETAGAGVTTKRAGSFFANYTRLQYDEENRSRFAGLTWTKATRSGWILSSSYNRNLDDGAQSAMYFGATIPLNRQSRYVAASIQKVGHSSPMWMTSMQQGIVNGHGLGWRTALSSAGDRLGGSAGLDYLGNSGFVTLDAQVRDGNHQIFGSANGSLVWIGGRLHAIRSVFNSLALVQTGVPRLPITRENRTVGVTDAHGNLLLTELNALQPNRVGFDPYRLPANYAVDKPDMVVIPRLGAASRIRFNLLRQYPVLLTLVDQGDVPIPLGAAVALDGGAEESVVGYDGKLYIEDLPSGAHTGVARWENGHCQFKFATSSSDDGILTLGPIPCLP